MIATMHGLLQACKTMSSAALDLLLPSVCPCCLEASGPGLCSSCTTTLPTLLNPCHWCGESQRPQQERCTSCQGNGLPHLDRIFVHYAYDGTMAQLVGLAKAAGRPGAVTALASLMPSIHAWAQLHRDSACAVTVVPASRGRRAGPHLGTACARYMAAELKLPFQHFLKTTHLAAEQHRLSPAQRRTNVADLFYVTKKVPKIIVLVDDLLTTGATLSAAAAALKKRGAERVVAACLARTPKGNFGGQGANIKNTSALTAPIKEIV